ncbi:MAG: malate dehydrogenase (oxaloacetate-decarboxylating)(NADP+), partial [Myxococcota bacterium]
MSSPRHPALDYHEFPNPGKIEVVPTKPVGTSRELSLAYSPGVAEPCLAIAENPEDVFRYTARGNLVAVVSNGTAVLGLGNIGASASKPVMEGKGVLFKQFAGIDVFDLEVGSEDPEDVIRFCQLLEPTVGGINLEDISAPDCFEIEERLKASLDIPVFHDDQHGTAIIGGAALINALEVVGKDMKEVSVVFSGAGASALSTAAHFIRLGIPAENIKLCDRSGVVHSGREDLDKYKARYAVDTELRTLAEALAGADVFIGLSAAGACSKDMVASMADNPIIFALANPTPEILPQEVKEVRSDAIMATGRSDYPNQVNNVLGFPFLFRGALDVRARSINEPMMLAATHALAKLAREDVPESVSTAYGGTHFEFGPEYLIPTPFDPRVLLYVAPAVAEAAMNSGVARVAIDLDEYRDRLQASLGPGRELMRWITAKARRNRKRVALADPYNDRVLRAAALCVEEGIAAPVLVGTEGRIRERAEHFNVKLDGIEILDPALDDERRQELAHLLLKMRARKGMSKDVAWSRLFDPLYYAGMLLHHGDVDAVLAGINQNYPEVLRPALQVMGTEPQVAHVAGLYMVALKGREPLFFADAAVNINPDAETLAEIAQLAVRFVRVLGITPRVAMLSFSNFGSANHGASRKVAKAVQLVRALEPELEIDGEMQADTAVNRHILT